MKNESKNNKTSKAPDKQFKKPKMNTESLIENNPDVKAFIYQQIFELTPYLTPETVVTVVARDAKKLIFEYDLADIDEKTELLAKSHRIAFILKEKEAKLEAEGVHENIFEAISIAKTYLVSHLAEIQNNVISNQDRQIEINQALQNTLTH